MASAEQIAILDEYSGALLVYQQAKQARLAAEVALDVAEAVEKTVGECVGDVRAMMGRDAVVPLAEGGQDDETNVQLFNGLTVRDLLS